MLERTREREREREMELDNINLLSIGGQDSSEYY